MPPGTSCLCLEGQCLQKKKKCSGAQNLQYAKLWDRNATETLAGHIPESVGHLVLRMRKLPFVAGTSKNASPIAIWHRSDLSHCDPRTRQGFEEIPHSEKVENAENAVMKMGKFQKYAVDGLYCDGLYCDWLRCKKMLHTVFIVAGCRVTPQN